jgi:glycosyltransferase involved in cell wall biosynthesis
MSNPSVSVIIAVKNGQRFLHQCLESVLAQTYQPSEIIIVDGHSIDNTAEIAHEFARSHPQIRYLLQRDPGLAAATNEGIQIANGDLVALISHDDLWTPDKLATQVNWMIAYPELVYTTAHATYFLEKGHAIPPGFRSELLQGEHEAPNLETLVARRDAFDLIGLFNTELTIAIDIDWFSRARDANIPAACLPQVLLHKRVHNSNLSNTEANTGELLKVLRESIQRKRAEEKP